MRLVTLFSLLAPGVFLAATVAAGEPVTPVKETHINNLLPTLTLAGSSSGKTSLSAGLSIYWRLTGDLDLNIAPAFTLTTADGIGQLFNVSGDNIAMGSPWKLDVNGALLWLDRDRTPAKIYRTELLRAGEVCSKQYTEKLTELTEKSNKAFEQLEKSRERLNEILLRLNSLQNEMKPPADAATKKALQAKIDQAKQEQKEAEEDKLLAKQERLAVLEKRTTIDKAAGLLTKDLKDLGVPSQDHLCEDGIATYNRLVGQVPGYIVARDRLSAVPKLAIAAGFSVGQVSFKYLEGATAAPMMLQDGKSSHVISAGAASLTYIYGRRGVTFELPLSYSSSWDAATTTAHVCTTVGQVGTDAAQSYSDRVVGAPTNTGTLQLSAMVGYADLRKLFWRAAAGPYLSYQTAGANEGQVELGLKTPAYLNFVAGINGYKGEYHGMIRLTPSIAWIKDTNGWQDVKFMIQAAVLGNRSMFPHAMEWLQQ